MSAGLERKDSKPTKKPPCAFGVKMKTDLRAVPKSWTSRNPVRSHFQKRDTCCTARLWNVEWSGVGMKAEFSKKKMKRGDAGGWDGVDLYKIWQKNEYCILSSSLFLSHLHRVLEIERETNAEWQAYIWKGLSAVFYWQLLSSSRTVLPHHPASTYKWRHQGRDQQFKLIFAIWATI